MHLFLLVKYLCPSDNSRLYGFEDVHVAMDGVDCFYTTTNLWRQETHQALLCVFSGTGCYQESGYLGDAADTIPARILTGILLS